MFSFVYCIELRVQLSQSKICGGKLYNSRRPQQHCKDLDGKLWTAGDLQGTSTKHRCLDLKLRYHNVTSWFDLTALNFQDQPVCGTRRHICH